MFTLARLFSFQYVSKNNSELQQRAIPKQALVLTIVDERDDSVERQVQRISAIDPLVTQTVSEDVTSNTQPEISTSKPMTEDAAVQSDSVSSTETPHVNVETDLVREARLEKQWKQLKVDMEELPDVYARLAKIKLTGRVFVTRCEFLTDGRWYMQMYIFFLKPRQNLVNREKEWQLHNTNVPPYILLLLLLYTEDFSESMELLFVGISDRNVSWNFTFCVCQYLAVYIYLPEDVLISITPVWCDCADKSNN